ncbi:uncharacterized protein LOC131653200 isoform X2 [Vicia villosa]|uniref:uncharacterized protein LOC131653200 isoform X2 n=1 Tax=Vicia villosa TaxID=3911 RepID=UPI00273CDAF9|nr:uncharacterized protein LOC131653200 isoform X2 [Vicia villosa]
MGKEWNWIGKSSKRSVIVEENHETKTTTPSGCMCAVFQFFDFHHFSNSINHQQQITFKSPSSTTLPKVSGGEAPRNSLESEDSSGSASLSKEEKFKIPNIQIKTKRSNGGILTDLSSEISTSSSPGTKTPTLVARLMGLDILPNSNSPSFSSPLSTLNSQGKNIIIQHLHQVRTKQQQFQTKSRNSIDGSETTRIPSSRKSDFDLHRLSLQINKENYSLGDEDFELPRLSFSKRKIDENSSKSSSHYAKQIVKQVKENVVSRKVGQDITNNLKNMQDINIKQNTRVTKKLPSNDQLQGREEFLGQLRVKKCPKTTSFKDSNPNSSSSPRSRLIDNKHKPNTTTKTTSKDKNTKPKASALKQEQESKDKKLVASNCKKATNEKFSSRFKKPPQTSDIIVRPTLNSRANDIKSNTKCKKIQPLSSNLVNNINVVSNVETESSPLSNKILQKQKQVSETQESKLQRYKPEFQYIAEIINKHVTTTKTVSFHKLFSSTHSIDPSIFNLLEHNPDDKDRNFTTKNQLGQRWNRKLMFDLVDEVLMEILKPKSSEKKLCFSDGFCDNWTVMELTEKVWKRVREFPCAKCEVLDDIDNLIESEDMEKVIKVEGEDETKGLVREIEGNILNTLVHETILVMCMIE